MKCVIQGLHCIAKTQITDVIFHPGLCNKVSTLDYMFSEGMGWNFKFILDFVVVCRLIEFINHRSYPVI